MQSVLADSDYTFDASAKEITLISPFDVLDEEQIISIDNLTIHALIYDSRNFTYPISIATGVLTHTYDSTGMADADTLQIIVDTGATGL